MDVCGIGVPIFWYATLFFHNRISRSKSKDFARGRSGGSVSSRVNKNNDCDIDGMTFENMFEDLIASTSKIGIEDGWQNYLNECE